MKATLSNRNKIPMTIKTDKAIFKGVTFDGDTFFCNLKRL